MLCKLPTCSAWLMFFDAGFRFVQAQSRVISFLFIRHHATKSAISCLWSIQFHFQYRIHCWANPWWTHCWQLRRIHISCYDNGSEFSSKSKLIMRFLQAYFATSILCVLYFLISECLKNYDVTLDADDFTGCLRPLISCSIKRWAV